MKRAGSTLPTPIRDGAVATRRAFANEAVGDLTRWIRIQRDEPVGGLVVKQVVMSHVTANRQVGEQIGALDMIQRAEVPAEVLAEGIYDRAEMDKRGRGGAAQQYVLHALSAPSDADDTGDPTCDCLYFWVRTPSGAGADQQGQIDTVVATPEAMLTQAYSFIRDLHELAIEERRAATEAMGAFHRTITELIKTEREEGGRLRTALAAAADATETTRETLWKHENETKRTDAEVAMKQEIVGALKNVVPTLLSFIAGSDKREHDTPSARQLYGFLKGLKEETFWKMLEPLSGAERANILTWVKNHMAFEEDLAKQDAVKKDRETPFPTPPAGAREHGDGTAPVGKQVPPAKG